MNRKTGIILGQIGIVLIIMGSVSIGIFWYFNKSYISIPIAVISIGISCFALSLANESELRMKALTDLNYYEKMAMLEFYKSIYAANPTECAIRDLEKCNYDIQAISAFNQFLVDGEKIKKRQESIIEVIAYARNKYPEYEDIIRRMSKNVSGIASGNEDIKKTKNAMSQLTKKDLLLGVVFAALAFIITIAGNFTWSWQEQHPETLFITGVFSVIAFFGLMVYLFVVAHKIEK